MNKVSDLVLIPPHNHNYVHSTGLCTTFINNYLFSIEIDIHTTAKLP